MSAIEKDNSHSDVKTTLEVDLELDESNLEKTVFISESDNRGFRIKTAGLYFMIHAIFIFWTFYYLHDRQGKHENLKKWFRNYDWVGCGYDIAMTSILVVCLGLLSFWTKLAKSSIGYVFVAIILGCYAYLTGFILRIACKSSVDLDEEICKFIIGAWCGGIGLLISACMPSAKFNKDLGMMISMPLYIVMLLIWRFAYRMDNPKYIITLCYILGVAFYQWYINTCLHLMLTKRTHVYRSSDWISAFGHLQTDIFAMFWVNLLCSKKKVVVDEQPINLESEINIKE
jgi:hypothetical protein